jgi:hypothetical protein
MSFGDYGIPEPMRQPSDIAPRPTALNIVVMQTPGFGPPVKDAPTTAVSVAVPDGQTAGGMLECLLKTHFPGRLSDRVARQSLSTPQDHTSLLCLVRMRLGSLSTKANATLNGKVYDLTPDEQDWLKAQIGLPKPPRP